MTHGTFKYSLLPLSTFPVVLTFLPARNVCIGFEKIKFAASQAYNLQTLPQLRWYADLKTARRTDRWASQTLSGAFWPFFVEDTQCAILISCLFWRDNLALYCVRMWGWRRKIVRQTRNCLVLFIACLKVLSLCFCLNFDSGVPPGRLVSYLCFCFKLWRSIRELVAFFLLIWLWHF